MRLFLRLNALIFLASSQSCVLHVPIISSFYLFEIVLLKDEWVGSPPKTSREFTERVQEVSLTIPGLPSR